MKKLRVGLIFGGSSAEHEVSVESVRHVYRAIDRERYTPSLLGVTKEELCHHTEDLESLLVEGPYGPFVGKRGGKDLFATLKSSSCDVFFPLWHGKRGEDGVLQALCRLLQKPCVGAGMEGSVIAMDKEIAKRLVKEGGFPVVEGLCCRKGQHLTYQEAIEKLGMELGSSLFIKPANLGSSIGVAKVHDEKSFTQGLDEAFAFTRKVLIERAVVGREIECAVMGNHTPQASLPGEVIAQKDFYSYHAKYLASDEATIVAPTSLRSDLLSTVQKRAEEIFSLLECRGMARVDFFLEGENVLFNEINTIPGFTPISLFPKLWMCSGMSYSSLLDRLIQLAVEEHQEENSLVSHPLDTALESSSLR